jgi:GAF domain-containing protein
VLTHLRQFFAKPRFADQERERAVALLYGPNLLLAGCGLLVATLGFLIARQRMWGFSVAALVILAVAGWSQGLLRRGYVQIAGALLSVSALVLLTASALLSERLQPAVVSGYVLVISLTGFLVGWQGAVACGVMSLVSAVTVHAVGPPGHSLAPASGSELGSFALTGGLVAGATLVVSAVARRIGSRQGSSGQLEDKLASREGELEKLSTSLRRRLDLLQTATGLTPQLGSLLAGDEIARRTVAFVHEMLGAEWAELFIREPAEGGDSAEREQLVLVASRGEGNTPFNSPPEGMSPNARALLARCMDGREPRVAEESRQEWVLRAESAGIRRPSVLLIPLRVEEEAVGVLALRPDRSVYAGTAFTDAVQYAADQVALALRRADAYARLQAHADESERLVRRYVEESWDGLVAAQPHLAGYRYTPYGSWADERAWLPPMTRAVQERVPVVAESAEETLLAIPLVQSDIIIGAIGLRRPAGQPWSEDEQLLVRAASEQVTQALENRRLFELAHDRARRERLLRRITERIRSQADLDGSLRVAADQLRKVTGATHVAIRLGRADKDA